MTTQQGGRFEQKLRRDRWLGVGLVIAGAAGLVCYILRVRDSELSGYVQGGYGGIAGGCLIIGLLLLVHAQYLLTHPQARRKARISADDERNQYIDQTASRLAGQVTLYLTFLAWMISAPLNRWAGCALSLVMAVHMLSYGVFFRRLSKKL